jgi:peptide-methionine (S)-S-oxide reductase
LTIIYHVRTIMTENSTAPHVVLGAPLNLPADNGLLEIYLAGGCFWGVERFLWETPGVKVTAVGYMGGAAPNPSYVQVCTGFTGHAETVRVVYDPTEVTTDDLLAVFFENHDPTQMNRQGNDRGTQYRSAVWTTTPEQFEVAQRP